MSVSAAFIKGLPKAEMHMHLEGSLEPDLKLQLAEKNGIDIGQSTIEEVEATYQFNDLTSFLAVYYPAMNVLQTEEDFYDLTMAYLKKSRQEEGVVYAEMFFDPQAHTSRGVSFADVVNGYYRATQDAEKEFGIKSNLIMCFLRDFSVESAEETYAEALNHKDKILGIGLDSDERDNPPLKFKDVFAKAREDGFHLTMHCDIDQENSIGNIKDVIDVIGVDRIDHGTNIVEDEALLDKAIELGIGFTTCPLSNGFVSSDMKAKEIVHLLNKGALVSVASDDPAYFGGYVADNIIALVEKENLTIEDVVKLAKNSINMTWLSDEDKEKFLADIDRFVEEN